MQFLPWSPLLDYISLFHTDYKPQPAAAPSNRAPAPAGRQDVAVQQRHSEQGKTSSGIRERSGVPRIAGRRCSALTQLSTIW